MIWKKIKKDIPRAAIVIDEDGLWHKYKTKENGLVPWDTIVSVKEEDSGYLNVFDSNKQKLIRISDELTDFNILRDMLHEKVQENTRQ